MHQTEVVMKVLDQAHRNYSEVSYQSVTPFCTSTTQFLHQKKNILPFVVFYRLEELQEIYIYIWKDII